jgi:hypothetical protein
VTHPTKSNHLTLLYEDLSEERDTVHFFPVAIDQFAPGIALYEFISGSYFSERYLYAIEPLRYLKDYDHEFSIDPQRMDLSWAAFVLPQNQKEQAYLDELIELGISYTIEILPRSKMKILRFESVGPATN